MLKYFISLLCAITLFTQAQAQLTDDFGDGDFTTNPTWIGQDSHFVVNPNFQLQLNAPAVQSQSYLCTPNTALDSILWELDVQMDFAPSSSNLTRVYLAADTQNLNSPFLNGYFVEIGGTADEVSLYRVTNGTSTKIIDGIDGAVANNPSVTIRVFRTPQSQWQLWRKVAPANSFISEGTVVDNTHLSTQYFGVLCRYTATRSTLFRFDNIYVGANVGDTVAPKLDSLLVLNNTTLALYYNEPLQSTSALDPNNYQLSPTNTIQQIQFLDTTNNAVVLEFSNAFVNGTTYNLTVLSQADTLGNVAASFQRSFLYFVPDVAALRDVVINEIFADPSPVIGLPEKEFIELYNPSNKTFSLKNWQYTDASTTIATLPDIAMLPGEYLILCAAADTSAFSGFGKTLGLANWPSLNNSSDELLLTDAQGNVIDRVNYTDAWYADPNRSAGGFSLEQINPLHPCSGINNWRASLAGIGGSPGKVNSVFDANADMIKPKVLAVTLLSDAALLIEMTEGLDTASVNLGNFQISNGISVNAVTALDGASRLELLIDPINPGEVYQLSLTGLADCFGNVIQDTALNFGLGIAPEPYDLVITELMPIPIETQTLPQAEYVELLNRSQKIISLDSVFIADASTQSRLNGQLMPGEYGIVLSASAAPLFAGFGKTITTSLPSLNNSGDIIALRLGVNGKSLLHTVQYSDTWFTSPDDADGGVSLESIDYDNLCGEAENWRSSTHPSGGTPARLNSVYAVNPDLSAPALRSAFFTSDTIIAVRLTEAIEISTLTASAFIINPELAIKQVNLETTKAFNLILGTSAQRQTVYKLEANPAVSAIKDCAGNSLSTNINLELVLPDTASKGELIVNEILFNPLSSSGSDYVELFNNSDSYFDLSHYFIGNYDELIDSVVSARPMVEEPYLLYPKSYVYLAENLEDVRSTYPQSAINVGLLTDLPSFANTEGSVAIGQLNKEHDPLEVFIYTEDMHFGGLYDVNGVALERISPSVAATEANNWNSAAQSVQFGTPGGVNSQSADVSPNSKADFHLETEVFSPDNDGFNDVCIIHYALPENGFVANVDIYNQTGALIKNLTFNEFVNQQGVFIWDGTNNQNERVEVGLYVIYLDFYNTRGDQIQRKLTAVVAVR